jgi:hypothetical protein
MPEAINNEIPDSLTVPLRKPVDLAGATTYVLELREPTVDELQRFTQEMNRADPISALKLLISSVSGVDVATIGRIGARDFKKAEKYLNNFFE